MFSNLLKSILFCQTRSFNFKYPYPRELQPKPPERETIKPENEIIPEDALSENDKFNQEYINRNPRNLEQMLLEIKPNGFPIDAPDVVFWNKLLFEKSLKHTTSRVIHNSGRTVISASTKEWSIRKHLKSTIDNTAVINIARILAYRCLQSGILFVEQEFTSQELNRPKIQLLLKTLEEEGLRTKELSAIRMKDEHYL